MARSKRVGYAVVGLGKILQTAVLPAFRYSACARLVAVVSGDMKNAKRLAARFGAGSSYTYDEFAMELDAFADSIRQKRDPGPGCNEGLHDVLTMQAIYQAARKGQWVPVEFPADAS